MSCDAVSMAAFLWLASTGPAAPQAAPALLTRMSSLGSRESSSAASASHPARVETSRGMDTHVPPSRESSAAAASHASALRAVM